MSLGYRKGGLCATPNIAKYQVEICSRILEDGREVSTRQGNYSHYDGMGRGAYISQRGGGNRIGRPIEGKKRRSGREERSEVRKFYKIPWILRLSFTAFCP